MTAKFPLISVVMLNYNGLKYIKRTVPPILELDYPNYEFVIADNGSTDGSIEFIKDVKKKSRKINIRLIENGENLGYSKGKNIGVKRAKGKYILLMDNDILINSLSILKSLLNFYTNLKNPAFVNVILIDESNLSKKITKQYGSCYGLSGIKDNRLIKYEKIKNIDSPIEIILAFGGTMFVRKIIWEDLGSFDESQPFNLDDDDISTRALVYGHKNFLFNKNYFVHIGEENRKKNSPYRWKYRYYFSGKAKSIIKNFQIVTIAYTFPLFFLKTIAKTFKQAIFRRDILLLYSFLNSITLFIRDLPDTLDQRTIIQSRRVVKDNIFLKIKPPKFD